MAQIKVGDEVVLVEPFKVFRILFDGRLDICDSEGNCISVELNQVNLKTTDMKAMKDAVLTVAQSLAKAKNTVTTLEIKIELRRDYPYYFWTQQIVSDYMDQLAGDGLFTYTDNGTYRIYSLVGAAKVSTPAKTLTKTVVAGKGTANVVVNSKSSKGKSINQSRLLQLCGDPNFVSVTLANGKVVDKYTIKGQKKSPVGYITPKVGKVASILVGTTLYTVK